MELEIRHPCEVRTDLIGKWRRRTGHRRFHRANALPLKILLSIFRIRFVGKTVKPAFPRLCGSDNGMTAGFGVLTGVPIGRGVAAERNSAGLACAEVNPQGVDFHALFALMLFGVFY